MDHNNYSASVECVETGCLKRYDMLIPDMFPGITHDCEVTVMNMVKK